MNTFNGNGRAHSAVGDSETSSEVLRLRRTVRDLVALSALPCIWVDCDLERSLQNLTDVLRTALRAVTVCVRIEMPGGIRFDAAASEGLSQQSRRSIHAAEVLDQIEADGTEMVSVPRFNGSGTINVLPHPVFANGTRIGMLVACFREDFSPEENERLILQVAANQVMLLLQRQKAQEEQFALKFAEERLRETEHHYRQLVESLPAAVYACDNHGRITLYNEAAVALWGRRPKIGQDMWCGSWKIWRPDGSPLPLDDCPMAIAVREGRSVRGHEIVVERPDGTRSFVLPHPEPLRDASGDIVGTVNMLVVVDELKRVEHALRAGEARLQSLLNLMPAAVYACDTEGRITFYNRRAAELWGREPKLNDDHQKFCAAYRCWFNAKVLVPDQTPMAIAVREGKSFRDLEPIFESPDGTCVPVLVNIDPILDADGKPAGAINVFQDVSRLKCAEDELRRKNAQLATFLETAALGLHRVGPDGTILWANAAEMRMLGYAPEEYIGHHIAEFHADEPVIDEILCRLTRGERIYEREARLRCKDGSIKHVLIDSNVLMEEGKFIHTQCFTRDVTDRKRAEEKASRLAAIVEHSDDAIFSTDIDGVVTSWNRGAERLYGYTAPEVLGHNVINLVPENRRAEEAGILDRIRRGEAVENYETIRRRKDGTLFDVSLTVSPVKNSQGNVIGVSKVARDITDKIRAREMLEDTVAERTASLKKALAQLEEFSYSVSHDLRAPLRAIEGYARILSKDCRDLLPPEGQRMFDKITRNTHRMHRLINDVLTLSRVAQHEIQLRPTPLRPLVEEIIEQHQHMQPPAAQIEVGELATVAGDDVSLVQAISNLLSNAVKFVPPGVTPHVKLWTEDRGDMVRLWIHDNGLGIKPELQGKLFGMFQRLRPQDGYDGTGIGLAIVRKAVERMGGIVGVESEGKNGSRFWIDLPPASNASSRIVDGVPG